MGRKRTPDSRGPVFNPVTGYQPPTSDYWPQSQDRGSYRIGDLSERMKGEPNKEGDPVAPGITWRKTTIV